MTAAPSGWLTVDNLYEIAVKADEECTVAHREWRADTTGKVPTPELRLMFVARAVHSALSHQAALATATATDRINGVIDSWQRLKACSDEFAPDSVGACAEYEDVLYQQLDALLPPDSGDAQE